MGDATTLPLSGVSPSEPVERGADETGTATVVYVTHPDSFAPMRDLVGPWQHVWDVRFVPDGAEALACFDEVPVDVLVADLDVRGKAVPELIGTVRQRSPHTARIILTDPADRGAVFRVIDDAHQCLSKPIDIEVLAGVIEHIRSAARNDLRDPVRTLTGQVDKLPSPPALFQRLAAMMAGDDWKIEEIAAEISQDLALTAEILKLVNSAFFGTYREVSSVERAISLVGLSMIRFVVLGNKLYQSSDDTSGWLDLNRLDARSKAVANGARSLALRDGASSETAAEAYLTGMVSEIGLLVMARVPDVSPAIAQPLNNGSYPGAERAIFGGDRFQVGCQLLRLWGFGEAIIDAIGQLSCPVERPVGLAWYLIGARRLVTGDGVDLTALAEPAGVDPETDDAIDRLRAEVDAEWDATTP